MMLLLFPRRVTTQNRYLGSSPIRVSRRRHHRRHHPVHATRSRSRSGTRTKASHHSPRRRRNIRIRRRRRCYHPGRYRKKKRQPLPISRRRPQRCRSIIHGILSFKHQHDTTHRNNAASHRSREVRRHTYIQQECNGKTKPHAQTKNGEEIGG